MKKPRPQSKGADSIRGAKPTPAPIRLVEAFRDAVKASKPEWEPSREALAAEMLLIAGVASFEALNRLDDLSRAIEREGGSASHLERWEVEIANQSWYEAATTLRYRLDGLRHNGWESETFEALSGSIKKSYELNEEADERHRLEREALRAGDLAALAARLGPRQDVYDVEGEG